MNRKRRKPSFLTKVPGVVIFAKGPTLLARAGTAQAKGRMSPGIWRILFSPIPTLAPFIISAWEFTHPTVALARLMNSADPKRSTAYCSNVRPA